MFANSTKPPKQEQAGVGKLELSSCSRPRFPLLASISCCVEIEGGVASKYRLSRMPRLSNLRHTCLLSAPCRYVILMAGTWTAIGCHNVPTAVEPPPLRE